MGYLYLYLYLYLYSYGIRNNVRDSKGGVKKAPERR